MKYLKIITACMFISFFVSCKQENVQPDQAAKPELTTESSVTNKKNITLRAKRVGDYTVAFWVEGTTDASYNYFKWTFGDNTSITTSAPYVVHKYPKRKGFYYAKVTETHRLNGNVASDGALIVVDKLEP
ncbi:PKD domain-containing protein [Microscilla marina]|uniref:Lipoprotein, putative n=1 Tax=Microscilla marina ATCC 23134 TaxID=313606 RepID=A1ZDE6_MICM2|nr:hypothetical protein [Microscilla marina]EAY31685.1 lipoprotein, putative [Microscilla marina ATCC 23134]